MQFQIVVTEVTVVGDARCVAGFDLRAERMVRPEPAPGQFWNASSCGEDQLLCIGNVIAFEGAQPTTDFPHRTEDVVVTSGFKIVDTLSDAEFRKALEQATVCSPETVFGNFLVQERKPFVPKNSACGSLAGVALEADNVRLFVDEYEGKKTLRVALPILGKLANVSVTAASLKLPFLNEGGNLAVVKPMLAGAKQLHVRLGLARAFDAIPDKCYLQVNGIYPI